MALYYDLPVFQDAYRMVLLLFQYTTNFPREYKFTLGQDMKRDGIVLILSINRANKAREKEQYLDQFLDDFELLKLEIRLSVDLHLVTVKQQAELALLLSSIGKQNTGWRNAVRCCRNPMAQRVWARARLSPQAAGGQLICR